MATPQSRLKIGNNVRFANGFAHVTASFDTVEIEDDCLFAAFVLIINGNHGYQDNNTPIKYQVSNLSGDKKINETVHVFMKVNFLLSVCVVFGYILFGKFLISIIANYGNEEIFNYGLYIIGGLCLFNTFRSLISYSIVTHSVKLVVLSVNLPSAIFAVAAYFIGGIYWGVQDVLVANGLISIVLSLLTVVYVNVSSG